MVSIDLTGKIAIVTGASGELGRVIAKILAKEVGKYQITVNQVAPGWMISDKYRDEPADDADYISRVLLARRGEDQDIANAVLFLAFDLAGFITGVYLPVCGGNEMPCI